MTDTIIQNLAELTEADARSLLDVLAEYEISDPVGYVADIIGVLGLDDDQTELLIRAFANAGYRGDAPAFKELAERMSEPAQAPASPMN